MSPDSSRIIPAEEVAAAETWDAPAMDGPEGDRDNDSGGPLTANQVEEIQRQAYEEGYAKGLQEGRDTGRKEMEDKARRLEHLMGGLARPFEDLDQQVEDQLVNLVLVVTRQLVRREIRTDPGQIVAVVREATAMLPLGARDVRLHLHPDDAQLVREALPPTEGEPAWRIVEDPVLSRGGCKVATDDSQVDATVENRIAALAAQLLGGERREDTSAEEE